MSNFLRGLCPLRSAMVFYSPRVWISAEKKRPAYQISSEISRNGKMDSIATFEKNFAKVLAAPNFGTYTPVFLNTTLSEN